MTDLMRGLEIGVNNVTVELFLLLCPISGFASHTVLRISSMKRPIEMQVVSAIWRASSQPQAEIPVALSPTWPWFL